MEHITVTKQHMEAMEALAHTNIKVSEAKNALASLKSMENEYLSEREQKELARIQAVLDDSASLLKQTKENYDGVHEILTYASTLATFLTEAYEDFKKLLSEYKERDAVWQIKMKDLEDGIAEHRKKMSVDAVFIENEKKNIIQAQKNIERDRKKLIDERETLERAIKRLKENRV